MKRLNNCLSQAFVNIPPSRAKLAAEYLLFGPGKKLRPQLVYAYGQACGLQPHDLDPLAAGIECIHTYSLIHDDLPAMDDDDFRRDQPSCHRQFDEASAILAGDLLQALAFRFIAKYPHLVTPFADGCIALVSGQSWDVQNDQTLADIHEAKTGALFQLCCELPARLAQAPINRAITFGRQLGVWYQMLDDAQDEPNSDITQEAIETEYQNLLSLATHPELTHLLKWIYDASQTY